MASTSLRLLPALAFVLGIGASPAFALLSRAQGAPQTTSLASVVDVGAGDETDAALRAYEEWLRGAGADATLGEDAMRRIYAAAGNDHDAFKRVAFLIQEGMDGKRISDRHSVDMASVRERWIEETVLEVGEKNGWRIARSDSGNTSSGMKSDLDQTFYVWTWDAEKSAWKRAPELDRAFIDEFGKSWSARRPVTLDALDVASIEGRNRFPDPRDMEITLYWKEYERTLDELGRTPGAYKLQGAVVQQMQFRALAEIQSGNPRAFQVYGAERPGERWTKQPFDPDEAVRTMFGIEPDLMPGYAFGAALANFIELQHYLHAAKFETKYHLRTWEDSIHVLYLSEFGLGKEYKVEYGGLPGERRRGYNAEILVRLFPGESKAESRRRHALALEVSNDLRLLHKNKRASIAALRGVEPGNAELDEQKVFEALAREMFGAEYAARPDQVAAAVREHRRLASEFCLETVFHCSEESFQLLLDPKASSHALDPARYAHLLADVGEADRPEVAKRLRDGARLTFVYGLHALGEDKARELVARLEKKYPPERLELAHLWRQAGLARPQTATARALAQAEPVEMRLTKQASDLAPRVQQMVLADIGFERAKEALAVQGELAKRHLVWSGVARSHGALLDPGNLDALASIVRVYVESRGDMDKVLAAAVDELLLAVPVGGQILAATRGGISGAALMAAAIRFPVAGYGMLVYGLGESGYAIYDVEYAQPTVENLEDAVYRGFLGPSTRSYGGEPATFTDADERELDELEGELARIRLAGSTWIAPISADPDPTRDALRREAEAAQARARDVLEPRIAALLEKRRAWEEFRDESWAGGYFTEGGAQKEQKPFAPGLLAEVQPIVSFSAGGLIDFRARYEPARDDERLRDLERRIAAESDAPDLLRMQAERDELALQRDRRLRAQAYLQYARTGRYPSDRAASFSDRGIGVPELLHKLQRDSLYPWLIERWAAESRGGARDLVPSVERFVDDFFARHGDEVARECTALGLLDADWLTSADLTGSLPQGERLPLFPADSIESLKMRLRADFDRSQTLWEEFQRREKQRLANAELALQRRIDAYRAEAAGLWCETLREDADFRGFATALRIANVRRSAPRVEAVTWRHSASERAPDGGDAASRRLHLGGAVKLRVDPTLYLPPYTASVRVLRRDDATKAAHEGSIDGAALSPATRAELQRAIGEKARDLAGGGYFTLTRVFAASVTDLSSAPASAVRGLPGVAPGTGRPRDASTAAPRVLVGECLAFGTFAAPVARAPRAANEGRVPPLLLSRLDLGRTWSRIVEGRNAYGNLLRGVGSTGDSAKLTVPEAQGSCKLPDASVQMALALEVPERIEPDREFRLSATLRYGVDSKQGEVRVRLVVDGVAQESSTARGNGELTVACEYPFRELFPKSTEWNFMHDRRIAAGVAENRFTTGARAMHYQIRHDTPSFDGVEAAPRDRGQSATPDDVPSFIHASSQGFRITAEALRGTEVLLKLDVSIDHDLKGGVTLTPAAGAGAFGAGAAAGSDADAASVLASARPWEDGRVRELIDEWLRVSVPDVGPAYEGDTRVWRWTEWGVMECPPGVRATGAPDHGGMSRHEYLFEGSERLRSRRHFTLRVYLERRLRGEDGVDPDAGEESFGELLARSSYLRELVDDVSPDEVAASSSELSFLRLAASRWLRRAPETDGRAVLVLVSSANARGADRASRDAQAKLARYGAAGLEVVEVLRDTAESVSAFAKRAGGTHPLGVDAQGQVAGYFDVESLPGALLFDREGAQRGRAVAYDAVALDARVRALLGAAAPDPWIGTWKGKTPASQLPLDLELAIDGAAGGYRLVRAAGQLVVEGSPRSGAFGSSNGCLTIQDRMTEHWADGPVEFFETWTLIPIGTDRIQLRQRSAQHAPDWTSDKGFVYELVRVD